MVKTVRRHVRWGMIGLAVATDACGSLHATVLPSLDTASHRMIRLATTDKAVYAPGAAGKVLVTLINHHNLVVVARVAAEIYRDTVLVDTAHATASIPPSATAVVALPFIAPRAGERGYRVGVTAASAGGTLRDTAVAAIDVQTSRLHARFPRQCWISHWDGAIDATVLIAAQVAWHCNTVQSYASYYRPERAPPAELAEWRSLSNLTVSRRAIRDVIAAAHAANMPVGFFQGTAEAYADWPGQAVRPSLAWGAFADRCGLSGKCTADDLDRSPPKPDNWSRYGWRADHIDFFDPCRREWQDFAFGHAIKPMIEQFGFDFWQADTVGAPIQPTFDAAGRPLDTARCLTALTTSAAARLGTPVVLNSVSGWGLDDAVRRGRQPYLYRETWDFDTPYYPGLNGVVGGVAAGAVGGRPRALVQPAYINRTLAESCATRAPNPDCRVNQPAALLATAMVALAGSTWMNHADHGCIVTNVFIEGYHLPCAPPLVDALLSYKAFEVAYENLLRGSGDSRQPCVTTSGGTGGSVGRAGEVYLLGKASAGRQICHLLNLTGVASNDWADLKGVKARPLPLDSLTLKLYYSGNAVDMRRDRLWSASPDRAAGAAQRLPYTTGSDQAGHYVRFVLPSLVYWTMVVLETHSPG